MHQWGRNTTTKKKKTPMTFREQHVVIHDRQVSKQCVKLYVLFLSHTPPPPVFESD